MKKTISLWVAFLFLLPGIYAITNWFLLDARNEDKSLAEMGVLYKQVLPLAGFTFTQQIYLLLGFALFGFILAARNSTSPPDLWMVFRTLLIILASVEMMLLGFSLM